MSSPSSAAATSPAHVPERISVFRQLHRRARASRAVPTVLALLAVAPVVWIMGHAFATSRNIAYWDEIDSVVDLLIRLKAGLNLEDLVLQIFSVTNEHRTVTSRLLFVVSYALTGTVNFAWFTAIGNASIVVAVVLLVLSARGAARRLRAGVVLGFMIFHLAHYESFLWSGSSIDHFLIVAFAVGTIAALGRRSGVWLEVALACAALATFTLAHGLVLWPVGALILARERRKSELVDWCVVAAVVVLIYFAGFRFNPGHHIDSHAARAGAVALYWLKLLGAPLAFGSTAVAIALGAALLAIAGIWTARPRWKRDRRLLPLLWFIVGATLLIAIGRTELAGGTVFSRYLILGALGWSAVLIAVLERLSHPRRPLHVVACAVPLLGAFNVAQNVHYRHDAGTFVEHRDRAAFRFRQFGEDGRAPVTLHPNPKRATDVLSRAAQRGVYRIPPLCVLREFPDAKPSARITYYIDELSVEPRLGYISGWAGIPGEAMERGQLHVVLKSADASFTFTTLQIRRPDVVEAYKDPDWEMSGFRFMVQRAQIPPGDYQVGLLVDAESGPEWIMTEHRLQLPAGAAPATQAQ